MKSKIQTHCKTIHKHTLTIDRDTLFQLLENQGIIIPLGVFVDVQFQIPSDGDYSGMALDLDEAPLVVSWEETHIENTEE